MKSLKKIIVAGMIATFAFSTTAFAKKKDQPIDPASSRVVYNPTALPNVEVKKFKMSSFNLGLWHLDYAATENLNVGFQAAPPFLVFLVGGTLRYTHKLSKNVHLGVYGNAGVLGTFFSNEAVKYYGGGPMLTIGNQRHAITFSALTYGANVGNSSGYVFLPGIGISSQIGDRVKFNLEGYAFTTPGKEKVIRNAGALLYGLRIFSETGSMYGDISFLAPIFDGASGLYRVMPLGIPVIGFGFSL